MKLYYCPQTRAVRPRWLLEELGQPYELVRVDLSKGEQKRPEHRKLHPHGAVPALVDGDLTMFESGAICAYLADKFADARLAPPPGTAARGMYYQWMFYAMATMEPPVLDVFMNTVRLPEAERSAAKVEAARQRWHEVAAVLERTLADRTFILGEQFSAADVMVGSIAGWSRLLGLLEGFSTLEAYVKRLIERPAYKRASAD